MNLKFLICVKLHFLIKNLRESIWFYSFVQNSQVVMNFKFAIPYHQDKVNPHFGKSKEFCFITVQNLKIVNTKIKPTPLHQLSDIVDWIISEKVTHILASGIGQRAIETFTSNNIEVMWGVPDDTPEKLVTAYLDSQLVLGKNLCDH